MVVGLAEKKKKSKSNFNKNLNKYNNLSIWSPVSVTIDEIDMYRLRRFPVVLWTFLFTIQQSNDSHYTLKHSILKK